MPFYEERKQLEEQASREAAGKDLWSAELSDPARAKIRIAIRDCAGQTTETVLGGAYDRILRETGEAPYSAGSGGTSVVNAINVGNSRQAATALEAIYLSLIDRRANSPLQLPPGGGPETFELKLNAILLRHRISLEMVNGEMVEKESQELHAAVVAPLLRLLSGRPGWDGVKGAYQKALREISDGSADDAITDAGTALQVALELRGCQGNRLGIQIPDERNKGLIAPHDVPLLNWIAADRSEMGDAHGSSRASAEDAWLAVHVTGAVILRLASGEDRGTDTA